MLIAANGTVQTFSADWGTVLFAAVGLAITVSLLVWVYRSMQHPRLYLSPSLKNGQPVARWQAVVRYLVLTPIMVAFWFWVILIILTVAASSRSAEQLAVATVAVVGAARILAHVMPEGSHELGKTIPLAVLTIILIGGSGPTLEGWAEIIDGIEANIGLIYTYYWALVALDVVVTGTWFWRQRSKWAGRLPDSTRTRWKAALEPVTAALRAVRDFGKTAS